MKIISLFLASIIVFATGSAKAGVVNFSGDTVNMGTLAIGQSGTISITPTTSAGPISLYSFTDTATLPVDAMITFTYSISNAINPSLHSDGLYSYSAAGKTYSGEGDSYSNGSNVETASTNGMSSAPLVFASANMTPTIGTATIMNLSGGLAQITNMFGAIFGQNGQFGNLTYNVSSVPLPPALPLFAVLLAGMFGYASLRKRNTIQA